jgi:hypothetical protein
MDRCDAAACVCFVHGHDAVVEAEIRSEHAADRLLATLRACCERHDLPAGQP